MSCRSVAVIPHRGRRSAGHGARVLGIVAASALLSLTLAALLAPPARASGPRVLAEFPICITGGNQWVPAISGNCVIWDDMRGLEAIYSYNLTTKKESWVTRAENAYPAIFRSIVVWDDWSTGEGNIYGYNLTTKRGFPICTESHGQWYPAISGNYVVWQDHRSPADDIYAYNLTTKRVFPICTHAGYQENPAVSGNYVVWEDYRSDLAESGGSSDIYGYNLATRSEFPIRTGPGNQCDPRISGNIVVWDDDSGGEGNIYGYNLATGLRFTVCAAGGNQWYPAVSGNTVVWADSRNGVPDIYGYDLKTMTEFPICIAAGSQGSPRISGNTVVWADRRDLVDYDIYGATLSDVMSGYVYDGHSAKTLLGNPVEDAKVEVREAGTDDVLDSDYTDKEGKFSLSFDFESGTTYRATVTLESEDGRLVMKRDGETVTFSRDFTDLSPEDFGLQIDCSQVAKISAASMAKGDIENCASVWHYLQLNRQAAKELGLDLTSTLTVNVFATDEGGTRCWYEQEGNAIHLGQHKIDDDSHPAAGAGASADAFPPPWDFLKNRESHEFGHAMMNVIMYGRSLDIADVANHAGYVNATTGDSLDEGFGAFWTMVADEIAGMSGEPDKYDQWGYLATTNRRMAWSPVNPAAPMAAPTEYPRESHAVAGLLRTLQRALGGGKTGFASIIGTSNMSERGNVTDFHHNLVASGVEAAAVDPIFFSYGFFADANGSWTRDAGEEVGAGNGSPCRMMYRTEAGPVTVTVPARPERHDEPCDPNSFVVVNLSGVRSAAQESWVTVAVKHEGDPAADFSDEVLVKGASGLLFVYLDEAATGAVITARGPDGAASPDTLSFTAAEWAAARGAAVNDVVASKTFRVCRVTVGNPVAPKTMSRLKSYTVTATLKPRHAAGSYPVRIYKYRYLRGKWKSYGYVKAKAANYSTYTKCSCKVKLPYAGRWRLRAFAPADSLHKATWSRGYDYVAVR